MPILYACEGAVYDPNGTFIRECRTIAEARFGRDQDGRLRAAPPANWRFVDVVTDPTRLAVLCPDCGKIQDEIAKAAARAPAVKRRFAVLEGGKDSRSELGSHFDCPGCPVCVRIPSDGDDQL